MTDWQPIETAPKDGSVILAGRFGKERLADYAVVMWDDAPGAQVGFPWSIISAYLDQACHAEYFTHWLPLPEPPE